jgi:hypothetical protein
MGLPGRLTIMVQRKLGRGLDFLLSGSAEAAGDEVRLLELARIRPNPYQPRREFRAEELEELAASIREHGLLQPIVVRSAAGDYEIVAGERRFRAGEPERDRGSACVSGVRAALGSHAGAGRATARQESIDRRKHAALARSAR